MATVEEYLSDNDLLKSISYLAVRNSAWWDTHSSGKSVRAKGDASRVEWSHYFSEYILPFGKDGNKLVVSRAIKQIVRKAFSAIESENPPSLDKLIDLLKPEITSSVANHQDDYYYDYPTRFGNNRFIEFGSHSISLEEFILVVLELSKLLSRYGKKYDVT